MPCKTTALQIAPQAAVPGGSYVASVLAMAMAKQEHPLRLFRYD
jgi:hypothetical protein